MHYGVTIFPTDYSIRPDDLGRALEERDFESLWVAEHSHIPASRESAWPGGAELPKMYYDTLDPFVALTAAAMATEKLQVGTGIALVIQRDVIHLAKEVASLDLLSNGRFHLGIGAGWNLEEMQDHGADPARRFGRMRESVEALRAIWENPIAEYHGEQIDFGPMHQYPKPTRHVPVHVGGVFPGGMERAVKYADGWIPIGGRGIDDFATQVQAFDAAIAAAGRQRSDLELSLYMAPPKTEKLQELADLGVDRAVFVLPPAPRDEILPMLDAFAEARPT